MITKVLLKKIRNTSIGIRSFYAIKCVHWVLYSSFQLEKARLKSLVSYVTKYPKTIQLPITYHCNFDCVMCGIQNLKNMKDFEPEELDQILSDKLFKKIKYVGINGGEPFIKRNLEEYIGVILKNIPRLKAINIISNGFLTDNIMKKLEMIHTMCAERSVVLNISFSIDGINDMQDFHRGCKEAWNRVNNTISQIKDQQDKYCDSLGAICTITRYNIFRISEVESWAEKNCINLTYNLATEHVRIDNLSKEKDFSIFSDTQAAYMAREFFYKKAVETKNPRYYGLFLYILEHKRNAPCPCQYNKWVTLTPNKMISYCATHSVELGNGIKESPYRIFNDNIPYLKTIKHDYCPTCSHYLSTLNVAGWKKFRKDRLKQLRTF